MQFAHPGLPPLLHFHKVLFLRNTAKANLNQCEPKGFFGLMNVLNSKLFSVFADVKKTYALKSLVPKNPSQHGSAFLLHY